MNLYQKPENLSNILDFEQITYSRFASILNYPLLSCGAGTFPARDERSEPADHGGGGGEVQQGGGGAQHVQTQTESSPCSTHQTVCDYLRNE